MLQCRIMQKTIVCLIILTNNILAVESSPLQKQCPDVIICGTSDSSKQTDFAANHNQAAYQCYYQTGDEEMAKLAGYNSIRCKTMYGSLNPTIK